MKSVIALLALLAATVGAADNDPVATFKAIVSKFPNAAYSASSKQPYPLLEVAYDVKKTDSLVAPILGIISFTVAFPNAHKGDPPIPIKERMEFHWNDGRWTFARLINSEGKDLTNTSGGKDLLVEGPLKEFLASVGK